MEEPEPRAAVIIPHYNDVQRLDRCLSALRAGEGLSEVEVVVVDNGSDQDMSAVQADNPAVRFITEAARGAAAARNRGVLETTAPRLFFLDADCVPAPDWLTVALQAIENRDLVGGQMKVFDETAPPRSGAEAFEAVFGFHQERYIRDMNFSASANLLTWRTIFEDVGPMIVGLSEDKDWCHRAVAKGYRIDYDPALSVGHPSRSDWPALRKKWRRLTDESFASNGPGLSRRAIWALRAFAVLFSPLGHLHRVVLAPQLSSVGERLRGVATMVRLRATRFIWMLQQAAMAPLPRK